MRGGRRAHALRAVGRSRFQRLALVDYLAAIGSSRGGTRGSEHAPPARRPWRWASDAMWALTSARRGAESSVEPACRGSFTRLVLARPAASVLLATLGRYSARGATRRAVREPGADCVIHVRAGRSGAVPRGRGKVCGSRGLHKDVAWASQSQKPCS